MPLALGKMVTSLTSRLGILSRGASMRLAEETGIKMVDKTRELGRALNKGEIEEIFNTNLPEKCRPKLVTTKEECVPFMLNAGYTEDVALQQLNLLKDGAATIPSGMAKDPIYIPMDKYPGLAQAATVTHELEHALETNCRPKSIIKRKYEPLFKNFLWKSLSPLKKFLRKFNKVSDTSSVQGQPDWRANLKTAIQNIELSLKRNSKIAEEYNYDKITGKAIETRHVLNCKDSKKALLELNGNTEEQFSAKIRDIIRKYLISPGTYNSTARRKYKIFDYFMDIEKPAYAVQGKIERYAYEMTEKEMAKASGTVYVYDEAQRIARAERKLYRKNKWSNKLKKPYQYDGVKDIYKLVPREERKIIKSIVKDMDEKQRMNLFSFIKTNPKLKSADIKTFLDATKGSDKSVYSDCLHGIGSIEPSAISNPDFLEIAKMAEESRPAFFGDLASLSRKSPEYIRKFLELAKEELAHTNKLETSRALAEFMDHPYFDRLKSIAEINVHGYKPYTNWVQKFEDLSESEILYWETKLKQAAKEGRELTREIDYMFGSSRDLPSSHSRYLELLR